MNYDVIFRNHVPQNIAQSSREFHLPVLDSQIRVFSQYRLQYRLWSNCSDVTIQMKILHRHSHMVLHGLLFSVLEEVTWDFVLLH